MTDAAKPSIIADAVEFELDDADRDSLHTLPLSIIPLGTPGLQRARMLKDGRLHSVIELFSHRASGSGRIEVDGLNQAFEPSEELTKDAEILQHLAALHSYDVYSLRIELRRLGIDVNDHRALMISQAKSDELGSYMTEFTAPLIQQVFGNDRSRVGGMDQLLAMFRQPNKEEAVQNLKMLADRLGIDLPEVPLFLEEYGDVFLSLAYYRSALDDLIPKTLAFIDEMGVIQSNLQVRNNPQIRKVCRKLEDSLVNITASITGRFESFEQNSRQLWDDINADSFQRMKKVIHSHYTTIGGVLCGLSVKIKAWENEFPRGRGSPVAKADFIMSEMRYGISAIEEMERQGALTEAG